jgi:hypothetical protein
MPVLRLHDVPLPRLPPALNEVREAVQQDVRGLWAGMEALRLQYLPAANEVTFAPGLRSAVERPWRPPLGWISLAAAGALLAGLGFAQLQVQRHLQPTAQVEPQKKRAPAHGQKKLRRVRIRPPDRTDYSRGL